jgi:hypothetical protein
MEHGRMEVSAPGEFLPAPAAAFGALKTTYFGKSSVFGEPGKSDEEPAYLTEMVCD